MEKRDWKLFWQQYRNTETQEEKDLFFQVGKTIDKDAVSQVIFEEMIQDIKLKLKLSISDTMLEMCCGNGLLSKPLGKFVNELYAFDFTERLIETAKKFKQSTNIIYQVGDAKGDIKTLFDYKKEPNKFLMNDSLGYFNPSELTKIIEQINDRPFDFYITGIPSDPLKWNFYNTEERKSRYKELHQSGDNHNDGIGRWWTCDELFEIANKYKLDVSIESQSKRISTFRMNVLFINR
jgi:hypothetical protein